ncbi:hypothetical protein [Paraburkholderia sp. SIMBA_030]|uniref:hypothetical protein n=1 Tax=Paraburkholderia sp. SIMBA_030 TaxID=3085773 RepID=UPI00397E395C
MRYYHGGVGHLQKGQFLLPPTITNLKKSCSEFGASGIHRRDRVYVTSDPNAAFVFAAAAPARSAAVYEVEPEDLASDPDCDKPGLSFECRRARIVRVVQVLTEIERHETMAGLTLVVGM